MSEAKPTPGEWRAKQLGGYENPGWVILWSDKGGTHMRRLDYQGNFTESDARLIADAGTVFHTTGLTPSQLVEQRGQLVERVKELEETLDHMAKSMTRQLDLIAARAPGAFLDKQPVINTLRMHAQRAQKALSKARPNTAEGE